MKLEVSPLQLAEWLIHGIAVIIALLQVDSVNDRTRWSDTMGKRYVGMEPQYSSPRGKICNLEPRAIPLLRQQWEIRGSGPFAPKQQRNGPARLRPLPYRISRMGGVRNQMIFLRNSWRTFY